MKSIIYILSLSLVLAPVQTYAIAPVAIAGSVAGRVAVQTAGGAVIKKLTGGAISGLAHGAVALCITGQLSSLSFCQKIKQAMANDGVNYGGSSGSGANGTWEWEVEIYRQSDGCRIISGYRDDNGLMHFSSASAISSSLQIVKDSVAHRRYIQNFRDITDYDLVNNKLKDFNQFLDNQMVANTTTDFIKASSDFDFSIYLEYQYKDGDNASSNWSTTHSGAAIRTYYRTSCHNERIYLTNQEINNYFNKSINDNDITNIYNYDYAQHNNITINNNTLGGDTINNYKTEVENETQNITNNVVNQIVNNQIHIDNINDDNCTKDTEGRYNNCGANNNNDNPPNDNNSNNDDSGNNPSDNNKTCDSNPFFRRVCDWITWTQQKHEPKTDTKIDIKTGELPAIKTDKVKFKEQCPAPKQINIKVAGQIFNEEMNYQPLCDFFVQLKPFIVGLGYLSGAFIVAGRRF